MLHQALFIFSLSSFFQISRTHCTSAALQLCCLESAPHHSAACAINVVHNALYTPCSVYGSILRQIGFAFHLKCKKIWLEPDWGQVTCFVPHPSVVFTCFTGLQGRNHTSVGSVVYDLGYWPECCEFIASLNSFSLMSLTHWGIYGWSKKCQMSSWRAFVNGLFFPVMVLLGFFQMFQQSLFLLLI